MFLFKYVLNYVILKDIAVLVDIFKNKRLLNGVVYNCYNAETAIKMHKIFNENYVKISSKSVEEYKYPGTPHVYAKVGVVVNTSCKGWMNIFDNFFNNDAMENSIIWLLMTENVEETINIVSRYKIELHSDVTIISKHGNAYMLHEVYHTGFNKNGQLIVRQVGRWNDSLQIEVKDRKDLKGLVLRSMVVIPLNQKVLNKTFVRYLEEEQPDLVRVDPMHKFKGYAALKYFRDIFNIT